jgi:hypothetical protein
MKSYFDGNHIGGTKLHLIQYFDGQRIREISLLTLNGNISWLERTIPGILETGIKYRTAKQRLAAYEKRCCQRIG